MTGTKKKHFFLDNLRFLKSKVERYPYRVYLPLYEKIRLSPVHMNEVFVNVHMLVVPVGTKVFWGFESQEELDMFLAHRPVGWGHSISHCVVDGSDIEASLT